MSNSYTAAILLAATALVAGCNKAPGGQVAAVVDGKEITIQEINAELQAANVPENADKQAAQRALLQRVIERKLLIHAAEDKKLDKTNDYLSTKRRTDEMLLAQLYAKQQMAAVPVPSSADIDKFVADNGYAFSKREQLQLDQIRFATAPTPAVQKELAADHSMDSVAATLGRAGIKFDRVKAGLDTAQVPTAAMQQIDKLPPSEPFVVPSNGMFTVNTIIGRKPIESDTAKSRSAAVAAWRQQKYVELLNKQIASMKSAAKITYQPGFAPTDAKTPAAPAAK